jgi:4-amino-4-deoxy-L-arabinose transferase-like glycosyltransferase
MTDTSRLKQYRYEIALFAILILSAVLNFWNVWNQGISNSYYAAAVKSMLANPAVLFFNSFDAAGFITVDKPPVGLWVQAASAALFGFSGWSLVLPQALAGVGSVALIYLIVSRTFGKPAGLVSALALAVTPIFVAVSRNGTMDGILIFVLLLAIWVALKAARESSLPCLILTVILIGIGFNIKMIQAFIVVPAVLAIYLLGAREILLKRRICHLLLAVVVLLVVSLSWAVVVDSIPADQRPYIGGSGDNTVLDLIVNYNGIHRLENGMGGSAGPLSTNEDSLSGGPGSTSFVPGDSQNPAAGRALDRNSADLSLPPGIGQDATMAGGPPESEIGGMPGGSGAPAGNAPGSGTGRGGGMGEEIGSPGITRLFGEGLAGQISWLLPFTLIGLLALWRRPAVLSLKGLEDAGLFSERGLTVMALGLWLLPGLAYFSFTTGFHTYYLATIAPPLAGLAGIGAVAMYGAYRGGGMKGWILPTAILVTGLVQMIFLLYTADWSGPLTIIVGCGAVILAIVLLYLKARHIEGTGTLPKIVAVGAIALLFIAPFVWACTPLMYGSGNLPTAGPRQSGQGSDMGGSSTNGGMNSMPGGISEGSTSGLSTYLLSHTTNETWIVAEPSSMSAAGLIIETGKPVMALGGFGGSDQVLSTESLADLVSAGKIRYFYLPEEQGGRGSNSGTSAIASWVADHCTAIPSSEWGSSSTGFSDSRVAHLSGTATATSSGMQRGGAGLSGTPSQGTGTQNSLYDCAGYEWDTGV